MANIFHSCANTRTAAFRWKLPNPIRVSRMLTPDDTKMCVGVAWLRATIWYVKTSMLSQSWTSVKKGWRYRHACFALLRRHSHFLAVEAYFLWRWPRFATNVSTFAFDTIFRIQTKIHVRFCATFVHPIKPSQNVRAWPIKMRCKKAVSLGRSFSWSSRGYHRQFRVPTDTWQIAFRIKTSP